MFQISRFGVRPASRSGPAFIASLMLLLAAAGCEAQSPNGEALHRAVLRGDMAEVRRILQRDPSSVRATDEVGMTALHFTVVRLRVSPELAVTSRTVSGESTPGNLMDRGAVDGSGQGCQAAASLTSYDLKDLRHNHVIKPLVTTLDYAPMAEMLISYGAPIDAKAGDLGLTPLHLAASLGHLSVERTLLDHGADIAATDRLGLNALHMAAMVGNAATARLLLERGADANARVGHIPFLPAFRDDTPLSLAAICGHRDLVEMLLERGADPNLRVQDGFAPLHLAERVDIAALLIAHGASTTIRGYEDRTPLHQAAMQGRVDVAALLMAHGSSLEARDDQGRTPLLLTVDQPAASPEMVAFLIRNGAKVNARSSNDETPLLAALGRDREIVQMLLDAGAEVNSPDHWRRTPLHLAVQAHDLALVELLLSHGANANARDSTDRTPLYYTWGGSVADQEIAARLRQSGGVAR